MTLPTLNQCRQITGGKQYTTRLWAWRQMQFTVKTLVLISLVLSISIHQHMVQHEWCTARCTNIIVFIWTHFFGHDKKKSNQLKRVLVTNLPSCPGVNRSQLLDDLIEMTVAGYPRHQPKGYIFTVTSYTANFLQLPSAFKLLRN